MYAVVPNSAHGLKRIVTQGPYFSFLHGRSWHLPECFHCVYNLICSVTSVLCWYYNTPLYTRLCCIKISIRAIFPTKLRSLVPKLNQSLAAVFHASPPCPGSLIREDRRRYLELQRRKLRDELQGLAKTELVEKVLCLCYTIGDDELFPSKNQKHWQGKREDS